MNKGSVLLESLLAILICCVIVSLISGFVNVVSKVQFDNNQLEWDMYEAEQIYQP